MCESLVLPDDIMRMPPCFELSTPCSSAQEELRTLQQIAEPNNFLRFIRTEQICAAAAAAAVVGEVEDSRCVELNRRRKRRGDNGRLSSRWRARQKGSKIQSAVSRKEGAG